MNSNAPEPPPPALYRYFDADQVLLYVGISGEPAGREQGHIRKSDWMNFAASSTIERRETREEVRRAEREAIKAEQPIFNRLHNNTPEAKARLRAYLEKAGRLDLLTPGPKMVVRSKPGRARPAVISGGSLGFIFGAGGTEIPRNMIPPGSGTVW